MDANELMQSVYNIAHRLDEIRIFKRDFPFNNTEMQMMQEVVAAKEEGRRIISSGLAKKLGVTRSAISQIVSKLEQRGVVRRMPDGKDRKKAYIELSEGALKIYNEFKERANRIMLEVSQKLGEKKVEAFINGADEFIGVFDEAVAKVENEQ